MAHTLATNACRSDTAPLVLTLRFVVYVRLYIVHTVGSRVVLNNAAQRENVHVRADI